MIIAEIHIDGLPRPFPRLYVMDKPGVSDHISWRYTDENGSVSIMTGKVLNLSHKYDQFYSVAVTPPGIIKK